VIVFAALFLLGAAARIYGAWELRHNLNPDAGIVALMAKHMAEGGDFPIFFYGQAYMGSLEPMVSALFCALFGCSGFMVTLGTAFVSWLVLFAVYLWARDAHSPLAGLFAAAFCVIGPSAFLHYGVSPRGGYSVTILFSTLILWLSSKLIAESNSNSGKWLLLGLLAGLGWWSNQLIISSILTAAILGLAFLGKKIFSLNTVLAAAGFFIGSLPFWWWNIFNDWRSFDFAGSMGQTPFWEGIKIFFIDRFPDLLDLNSGRPAGRILKIAIYIGAAAWGFFIMLRLKARQDRRWFHLLTLYVFILVSALMFSTSHFAHMSTSRYLLPLFPAVAVLLGVATSQLAVRMPLFLAVVPLAFVIVGQFGCLTGLKQRGADETAYQGAIEECGKFLESRGISACYVPYAKHAWNFALREKICFCDLPQDRYLPYARRAELADRVAILDNFGDIDYFTAHYGGSASVYHNGAASISYNFIPPRQGLDAVSPAEIESISDSQDNSVLPPLTDGNLDSYWESSVPEGDSEWLEVSFKKIQTVGMIRFLYDDYPETWQIEGQPPGGVWKTLTPCIQTAGYLWSGPRPYWSWGMDTYRLECRIPAERLERIRIHHVGNRCRLREIQFFAPALPPAGEETALAGLLDIIHGRGIKCLYCDRWPANAVYRETKGAVQTPLNPSLFVSLSNTVSLTPQTAFLVRAEDAPVCRQTLADRLVEMRATAISPWVLFDFSPGKWKPEYGRVELQWTGFVCLTKNNKKWAAELVRRADSLVASDSCQEAAVMLKKACLAWKNYPPAVERLAYLTERENNLPDAANWRAEQKKIKPEIEAKIKFENGVEFCGISFSANAVRPDSPLTIRYYWKYPAGGVRGTPCVFVHFSGENSVMQDDHLLEKFEGSDYQPYPEVFVETRRIVLSKHAPEGKYQIRIGLYDASRKDQKRVAVRTALPSRLNAVELPVTLTVKR